MVRTQGTRQFAIVGKAIASGDADGAAINHCINGWMVFWYDFRPCTRNVADGGIGIGMADDFQQRSCHHQVAQAARFDDDD
ncbi:MAG: hypothetical protein E6I97_14130 [Chloroflexi bacterium]|nr:MAG: hypothetical protein E6I97_14130 [Chloroflexota bacterium]